MQICSLKGDYAFRRLRKGRVGYAKELSVRWRSDQKGCIRVAMVVSKKVGKAVVRNLVRRRLREALREILRKKKFNPAALYRQEPSLSLIVIAKPEATQASYGDLKKSLEHALGRAQLFL